MHHLFITRLAVAITGKASRLQTKLKTYDSINDRIQDIIQYWHSHASKFYTQQTIDSPFKVFLVYSDKFESIVKSFDYPDWVHLTRDRAIDKICNRGKFERYDQSPMSLTRIDADDWYSNDYFEMLQHDHETTHDKLKMTTLLHKRILQFNRSNNTVSLPVTYTSPGFASYVFKQFDKKMMPVNIRLWPHGQIKRRPHITPDGLYCMQSVGINAVNRWRMNTTVDNNPPESRFYIPKDSLHVR